MIHASGTAEPAAHAILVDQRVLVADDDDDARRLIAAVLRGVGYTVAEARDGVEALDKVASTVSSRQEIPFAALVSDVDMPGLSGLDVIAALRCSKLDTPVVLVTGTGDADTRSEAAQLGVSAYLEKPVRAESLRRAVERAVAAGPGRCGA